MAALQLSNLLITNGSASHEQGVKPNTQVKIAIAKSLVQETTRADDYNCKLEV